MTVLISDIKPYNNMDGNYSALDELLRECIEHQKTISRLEQIVSEQHSKIAFNAAEAEKQKGQSLLLQKSISSERTQLDKIKNSTKKMQGIFDEMKGMLACNQCEEVALFPSVVGECGHISCQSCLGKRNIAIQKEIETFNDVEARQCSCKKFVFGISFPVFPLKNVAHLLVSQEMIPASESAKKSLLGTGAHYISGSEDLKKLHLWCLAETARRFADSIYERIVKENEDTIYIRFPVTISHNFISTFSYHLLSKGIEIHVSRLQYTLKLKIKKPAQEGEEKEKVANSNPKSTDPDTVMKDATSNGKEKPKYLFIDVLDMNGSFDINRREVL